MALWSLFLFIYCTNCRVSPGLREDSEQGYLFITCIFTEHSFPDIATTPSLSWFQRVPKICFALPNNSARQPLWLVFNRGWELQVSEPTTTWNPDLTDRRPPLAHREEIRKWITIPVPVTWYPHVGFSKCFYVTGSFDPGREQEADESTVLLRTRRLCDLPEPRS